LLDRTPVCKVLQKNFRLEQTASHRNVVGQRYEGFFCAFSSFDPEPSAMALLLRLLIRVTSNQTGPRTTTFETTGTLKACTANVLSAEARSNETPRSQHIWQKGLEPQNCGIFDLILKKTANQ
jgi:hypothetical protein